MPTSNMAEGIKWDIKVKCPAQLKHPVKAVCQGKTKPISRQK